MLPQPMSVSILPQLSSVRDSDLVERLLIANSRTAVYEVNAADHRDERSLKAKLVVMLKYNKPIVVRGAGRNWKVVKRWGNPDELLAQAKAEEDKFPNRKYTAYQPQPDGHLNQSHAAPFGFLTFYKYLKSARAQKLYLLGVPDKSGRGASPFELKKGESAPPIFAEDIDSDDGPKLFISLFNGSLAIRRHVFFNSAYSFTNLHYDTDWNTYLCVLGRRAWTIAHPDQSPFIGAANGGASYSILRPTNGMAGMQSSRLAHLIKFVRVELEAGDVLCLPPTWWHVVEGLTDGFSCGINWFHTFPKIDTTSPLDEGWSWMNANSRDLIMKASMQSAMSMSVHTAESISEDEEEPLKQPPGAGEGLRHCSDSKFVDSLFSEVQGVYGTTPYELSVLRPMMCTNAGDHSIARQLLRIAVNSCVRDNAPVTRFSLLCTEVARILSKRNEVLSAEIPLKKRKR